MKTIRSIFAIGLTALLVSCGTSKETTSSPVKPDRGVSNVEKTPSKSVENAKSVRANASDSAIEDGLNEMEERGEMKRMYVDLDMDDAQIMKFEKGWNSAMETWKRSNPNKAMNRYEKIETQDRILRGILDDAQLEAYQMWLRDNAD